MRTAAMLRRSRSLNPLAGYLNRLLISDQLSRLPALRTLLGVDPNSERSSSREPADTGHPDEPRGSGAGPGNASAAVTLLPLPTTPLAALAPFPADAGLLCVCGHGTDGGWRFAPQTCAPPPAGLFFLPSLLLDTAGRADASAVEKAGGEGSRKEGSRKEASRKEGGGVEKEVAAGGAEEARALLVMAGQSTGLIGQGTGLMGRCTGSNALPIMTTHAGAMRFETFTGGGPAEKGERTSGRSVGERLAEREEAEASLHVSHDATFALQAALYNRRVTTVAAGLAHALALCDGPGAEVLAWGRGVEGQLGHGSFEGTRRASSSSLPNGRCACARASFRSIRLSSPPPPQPMVCSNSLDGRDALPTLPTHDLTLPNYSTHSTYPWPYSTCLLYLPTLPRPE